MKESILRYQHSLGACIAEVIIGIWLLVNPESFGKIIGILLGAVLLLQGILCVARYFKNEPSRACLTADLSLGLLMVLGGLFLVINKNWLIDLFEVVTVLYGVILLILTFAKIQWTVDRVRGVGSYWFLAAIDAALTAVFGILIITVPTIGYVFIAVSMIVSALVDLGMIIAYNRLDK